MQFNEIITFEGGINTDDTPQSMPKGDYRDFSYCRLGYNSGNAYAVETADGTLVIPNTGPDPIEIQDQILGATQWIKENSIVYFVFKADLDHQIWVYDITNQTHTLVIESSELNFSREWPIFHANVIDDILKWTDGRWDPLMYDDNGNRLFNPPYQINLRKALDGDYPTITLQTIDAIKWPMDPPVVNYFTDTTRNDNKLRNKLFKFIIQPIYENGEPGVWSMYSNLDLPDQSELVTGTNWVFLNNDNGIRIQFNTGPSIIRKFNIAVQQFDKDSLGAEPPFGIFLQLDKDQDGISDNDIYFVNFYGGVSTYPAVDVFKNYDRLPIVADCQEYLPTSELTYVNFREGYDKPTEAPFVLDAQMDYSVSEIIWNPLSFSQTFEISVNPVPFPINRQLRINNSPFSGFIPIETTFLFETGTVYSFIEINTNILLSYYASEQDVQDALALFTPGPIGYANSNIFMLQRMGDSFCDALGIAPGVASNAGGGLMEYLATFQIPGVTIGIVGLRYIEVNKSTFVTPSLKAGATHEFGIVYGDRAYRDSTVYTIDSLNLFVPWFYDIDRSGFTDGKNPFTVTPRITINHVPPIWATKYWIVAKPANEIASFGQWVTNRDDDSVSGNGYVASIRIDTSLAGSANRYVIDLDSYYENENLGAVIRHEIKIGDKLRFIRRNAYNHEYVPYLEVDILDVQLAAGPNGRTRIYTNIFDTTGIEPDPVGTSAGQLFGQLLEIYTPRPSIDDTGSLFVSTWKDVTEAIQIINPHTLNRSHNVPPLYRLYVSEITPGVYRFTMNGDHSSLTGQTFGYTRYNDDGTTFSANTVVGNAVYSSSLNITSFTLTFPAVPTISYISFDTQVGINSRQVVSNLNSGTPASFPINYGDVYIRQRNYIAGFDGVYFVQYWYIEDPHYSDYWSSNVHSDGRIRIEDNNAKMAHRQATAIHSDSFIVGTQINGLSSFALDNQNIEDMNPTFGPVIRAYMSGREGKTLKCLQPKKENSIYIQYYPNEVGSDSTVRVSNRTFASWFDYKSLLGCSNAGATAILPNGATMYFDNNAGVFVYSGGNGQIQVSEVDPDTKADYKFRTKTKALSAAYNASSAPMVRTYVNESVGEVGFAFRFDVPFTYIISSIFNPPFELEELWSIPPNISNPIDLNFLYGLEIIIVHENGEVYNGVVNYIRVDAFGNTNISLDTGGPAASAYGSPAYFYVVSGLSYDHVVFDYVNMRWRSTYDYNFQQYCNLGQTLVGWGIDNQLYLHNQPNQWNFHGEPFVQKVSFVSNDNPLMLKRYQDITLVSDDLFSIMAESEPNRSYPLGMKTTMPTNLISTYEGYGKVNYRKNLYDPKFFVSTNSSETIYDPPADPINGWDLNGDQTGLEGENITIIQNDGNIYTGVVNTGAIYNSGSNTTSITLQGVEPGTDGVTGNWYMSERAYCNGQDIRANALTHTLEYDPAINNTSSILVSVGIKGVLS